MDSLRLRLVEDARNFTANTPLSFDEQSFVEQMEGVLSRSVIETEGDGHCIAVIQPSLYDRNQLICQVISTYGEGGLACFRRIEQQAHESGCQLLMADSWLEPRIIGFYRRQGMIETDRKFLKVL